MADPQTVADTDAGAKPQTEDKGAQEPSIDELLKQFEATETPPEQAAKPEIKADDLREVVSFVKEDREERIREKTDKDVLAAAQVVKGDLDLDDDVIVDFLYGKASRDPRFLKAFQMRHENPDGWNRVLKAQGKELVDKFGPKIDQNLTDDHAAVAAAVRSASTGSSEEAPPDFNSMSDAEFNAWQRKNIK